MQTRETANCSNSAPRRARRLGSLVAAAVLASVAVGFVAPGAASANEGTNCHTATYSNAAVVLCETGTLEVKEGSASSYELRLGTAPTHDVTVTLSTGGSLATALTLDADTGAAGNQTSMTFTPANYSTPQAVLVTAARARFGNATISHSAASTDTSYDGLSATLNVSVSAILVAPTSVAGSWSSGSDANTLTVTWSNTGASSLEHQVMYRLSTSSTWTDAGWTRSLSKAITGLDSTATYVVTVRSRDLVSGYYGAWAANVTISP